MSRRLSRRRAHESDRPSHYRGSPPHVAVDAIVVLAWPIHRAAALLMLPYSAWTLFTTALSRRVRRLN